MLRDEPPVRFLPETIVRDTRRRTSVVTVPNEAFIRTYHRPALERAASVNLAPRYKANEIGITVVCLFSVVGAALAYALCRLLQ